MVATTPTAEELFPLNQCRCHNDSTYKAVHKTYGKILRHLRGCLIIVPSVLMFERWRYGAPRRMVRVSGCVDPLASECITQWFLWRATQNSSGSVESGRGGWRYWLIDIIHWQLWSVLRIVNNAVILEIMGSELHTLEVDWYLSVHPTGRMASW